MPSLTDEAFVALWKQCGSPSIVSQRSGVTLRNILARRKRLANKGIFLQTVTDQKGNASFGWQVQAQPYTPRANEVVKDGYLAVFGDAHFWPAERSLAYDALLVVLKRLQPKLIIANGDVFDGATISRHEPMGWQKLPTAIEELEEVKLRLEEIRRAAPKSVRRMTVGNHDCLDSQTQCLTRRGWTPYTDIRQDDQVLSLANGLAEWTAIDEVVRFPFDGELVRVEKTRMSMAVTGNHRVLCNRLNWRTKQFDIAGYVIADQLPYSFNIPTSGQVDQPEAPLSDDQLELAGWILTDGHYGPYGRVNLYQSKSEGVERIDALLARMGITHVRTIRQRQRAIVCGRALLADPLPAVEWRLNAKAGRAVRAWLPARGKLQDWALSARQFGILLDAIIAGDGVWDGTAPSEKRCAALYGTERFLDSVQAAAVQHGWRARLARDNRGDFRLCLSRQLSLRIEKPEVFRERYVGDVWCLRVPHGNFMVRRNGCAYFTGNSRFDRRLATETPEFKDVEGFRLSDHLKDWPMSYSVLINEGIDPVFVVHNIRGGMHAPFNNAKAAGCTVITGHLHSQKVMPVTTMLHDWEGIDHGVLACREGPQFSYRMDRPADWRSGFCVLRFDREGRHFPAELCRVQYLKNIQRAIFRGEVIVERKK